MCNIGMFIYIRILGVSGQESTNSSQSSLILQSQVIEYIVTLIKPFSTTYDLMPIYGTEFICSHLRDPKWFLS